MTSIYNLGVIAFVVSRHLLRYKCGNLCKYMNLVALNSS